MADSFQREKPPARVNLFLEVQDGGAPEKVELPMRLLVLGDYTGRADGTPVAERDVVNVDRDNFASVMRSQNLRLDYSVPNRLQGGEEDLRVRLDLGTLKDFEPEQIARQIPELRRMLAMRNLLQDLRNRVVSASEFRKHLEAIVRDEAALQELTEALGRLVAAETPAAPALPERAAPSGDGV